MAVYVDPLMEWPKSQKWPWGSVSHMYADTEKELHSMAKKIGLKREWCSDFTQPGSKLLHYDLNSRRREAAIHNGAIAVDQSHKEPWLRLKEKCFPVFVEWLKRNHAPEPTPQNYDDWQETYEGFRAGWLAAKKGIK